MDIKDSLVISVIKAKAAKAAELHNQFLKELGLPPI